MNDAYNKQTGYTREEAVGRNLERFRQSQPDDAGMQHVRDAVKKGEPTEMEIVSYRKDGSSYWNQVTMHPIRGSAGGITHWVAIERDVSQAVEREAKLEDQQARLLLLTLAARRLFSTFDYRVIVERMQQAVRELLHAGAAVHAVGPGGHVEKGDALLDRAALTRGHICDESRTRAAASCRNGEQISYIIEVRAQGRTLHEPDLFVLDLIAEYFSVAVRNASLVAELDDRRSAILQLNQVKTDLIAMLAHDFKNPLTSIIGFTELAMEAGDISEEQREYLESSKRSALHLSDLASDTLAFSQLERNEIDLAYSQMDLGEMALEIAGSLSEQREVRVSIAGNPALRADEPRLRQVLYNLIGNAVKYSSVAVGVSVEGGTDSVRLRVADKGIGIPEKELAHIFGRFSRGSNARQLQITGTGFGLYLARQIVNLHGGTISVASEEGSGSTFTVELPRSAGPRKAAPVTIAVLASERQSPSFIAHALREAGIRVRVEHEADGLLAALAAAPIDGIVIDFDDVQLQPQHLLVLEAARRSAGFTIVAAGACSDVPIAGAVPLAKPFLVQDLLSAIRSRPA